MPILHVYEYRNHQCEYCVVEASQPLLDSTLGDLYVLSSKNVRAKDYPTDKVNTALHKGDLTLVSKTDLLDHLSKYLNLVAVVNDSGRRALAYIFV